MSSLFWDVKQRWFDSYRRFGTYNIQRQAWSLKVGLVGCPPKRRQVTKFERCLTLQKREGFIYTESEAWNNARVADTHCP